MDISNDCQLVLSGGWDGLIIIWKNYTFDDIHTLIAHKGGVINAVFSADDKSIVSSGNDDSVRIWNVPLGILICEIEGESVLYC